LPASAHHGGHGLQAGEPRRAPAPLAGDQLITVRQGPHEQRLQHAVESNRFRELTERFGVEAGTHLLA
jgi:hypothetical protein